MGMFRLPELTLMKSETTIYRYPIGACLWKPEDTFDAAALKLEFYAAATEEGILSSAKDHVVLLLREAADYGGTWSDDTA